MTDIRTFLNTNKYLVFDGAMGTLYNSMHKNAGKKCEKANIDDPETIYGIHRSYIDAGCNAIKTNTFSVSADIAAGDVREAKKIIRSGIDIAKKAAGDDAFVFADIGTVPADTETEPEEIYVLQAGVFLKKGINCFLIETAHSITGISAFAKWLKKQSPESCLFVCFAVGPDGFTRTGFDGRTLFNEAYNDENIDAVGFNCCSGPYHMKKLVSSITAGTKRICAMPNAGYPTVIGRRTTYGGTPEYFCDEAEQILSCGITVIGGCCGTTPGHISALRELIDSPGFSAGQRKDGQNSVTRKSASNPLWSKIKKGRRIIAVEYDPPQNDSLEDYLKGVGRLKNAGADAITVADCPVGIPHVDSSLLACKLKSELNIEPVPHIACRDRNLNAIKALLLGLSCSDVHNVLLVTGDPMPSEKRDEVKSVFNCNSRHLINYVSSLDNQTLATPFRIFAALNVNAKNFDVELELAKEKIKNGASGFMTQPILSHNALDNLKRAREELDTVLFAGIYPVVSYRNACYMNNEIAGIVVSDEICELYKNKDREESEKIALRLSLKIASDAEPYCDGLYIMTPFNRTPLVAKIIKEYNRIK